jgi:hypothetical protein
MVLFALVLLYKALLRTKKYKPLTRVFLIIGFTTSLPLTGCTEWVEGVEEDVDEDNRS